MQYLMDEKEHQEYSDRTYELIRLRSDNMQLKKINTNLEKISTKYEEIKNELRKSINVKIKDIADISETTIRMHSITELILRYTDIASAYDKEKILDTIKYI